MKKTPSYTDCSDETLVEMTHANDRQAFDTLCQRYLPIVYNRCRALLPPEAAEDVTQEVFIAALRGIQNFQGKSSVHTWFAAIVRNKVADYYRRQQRRPVPTFLDENMLATPAHEWEGPERVQSALNRLSPSYQEIILLRFVEELPFKEIAAALDISLEAAKSRYRRAVTAIAQELSQEQP